MIFLYPTTFSEFMVHRFSDELLSEPFATAWVRDSFGWYPSGSVTMNDSMGLYMMGGEL